MCFFHHSTERNTYILATFLFYTDDLSTCDTLYNVYIHIMCIAEDYVYNLMYLSKHTHRLINDHVNNILPLYNVHTSYE